MGRWILLGFGVLCAVWAAVYRAKIAAFFERWQVFYREIRAEMRKVSWPSKDEVIGNTVVVLATVAVLAVLIGIEDGILAQIVKIVFVRGSAGE